MGKFSNPPAPQRRESYDDNHAEDKARSSDSDSGKESYVTMSFCWIMILLCRSGEVWKFPYILTDPVSADHLEGELGQLVYLRQSVYVKSQGLQSTIEIGKGFLILASWDLTLESPAGHLDLL